MFLIIPLSVLQNPLFHFIHHTFLLCHAGVMLPLASENLSSGKNKNTTKNILADARPRVRVIYAAGNPILVIVIIIHNNHHYKVRINNTKSSNIISQWTRQLFTGTCGSEWKTKS